MPLGSTAFLPMSGSLAQVFGRRVVILLSLGLFASGSALCGFAVNLNTFITGRIVQGMGAGGITSLTEIIIADLVPLRKRGPYLSVHGATFAFASMNGPIIGGALAKTNWRWLFYINIPITGISMALVILFLDLKVPGDNFASKMKRMDWTGNKIVMLSIIALVIALSEGGINVPWTSYKTLVPLIFGIFGIAVFFLYEFKVAKEPMVPYELLNNRTSIMGYASASLHGLVSTCAIYYYPVYIQGTGRNSPLGVTVYAMAFTVAPATIVSGFIVLYFGKYRPVNVIGWAITLLGFGLSSVLRADSPKPTQMGFQELLGIGLGILFAAPTYAIMAALLKCLSANALALHMLVRNLSGILGIAVGSSILHHELKKQLSERFLAEHGVQAAYSLIPAVHRLAEPMQSESREALAAGLRTVWKLMFGVSVVGAFCACFMEEIDMSEETHTLWGLVKKKDIGKWRKQVDVENKLPSDFVDNQANCRS
ncbi:hypothetical protein FRB95_005416 [Tulasnella sp. JGI-2019a]|nr:hypothetical protein FRB95_005416 [Tulasnella sp. JGI-2019a]